MKKTFLLTVLAALAPAAAWANESGKTDAGTIDENPNASSEQAKNRADPAPSQAQIDELKQKVSGLEERLDSMEKERLADIASEIQEGKRLLDIYGFFDVSLVKSFIDDENLLKNVLKDTLSFMVSNLNLYLSSRMTETLSALIELRFTFAPNGYETYFPYERVDTTITDTYATGHYRLGGVLIERAHLTWQPYDSLGFTVGRFLTPFGIWNIDHGSPVLIPAVPPYLMLVQTIPLAQTGLVVHGRFFPFEKSYFDYALTVSNGRGPADEVFDIDDNKALGLRLRFERDGRDVDVAFGGYGYYGKTSDVVKSIAEPIVLGQSAIVSEETERFSELSGSLDFVLEMFGLRLQGEYARSLRKYEIRPYKLFPVVNIFDESKYQPDYIQWNIYGLLAWELPLEALLGDMKLTPYVLYEYSVQDDSDHGYDMTVTRLGLNFKPIVWVVLKVNASYAKPVDSAYLTPWWMIGGQIAVTF